MRVVVTAIGHILSHILAEVLVIWKQWNLRSFVISSFTIQLYLILVAPFRKQSSNGFILISISVSYLLADWIALQAVGFIPKRPIEGAEGDILGFWAQFLLVHLGGPDTITALALQDNDLWLRTGLHLGTQVYATLRILFITIRQSNLRFPTLLMFLAGVIKYSERVYALYCSRLSECDEEPDDCAVQLEKYEPKDWDIVGGVLKDRQNESSNSNAQAPVIVDEFRHLDRSVEEGEGASSLERSSQSHTQSELSLRPLDTSPTGKRRIVGLTNVEMVRHAYFFFNYYKGLYADRVFKVHEWQTSMGYFLRRTPTEAFKVLEMELNFAYEAFYTKMFIILKTSGLLFRLFVLLLEVVSLVMWTCFTDKRHFRGGDIRITYNLLIGAAAVDVLAVFRILFSYWNVARLKPESRFGTWLCNSLLGFWDRTWGEHWTGEGASIPLHIRRAFFRRWSESISQFNLINFCLDKRSHEGTSKLIELLPLFGMKYVKKKWFSDELRDVIFEELRPSIVDKHESGLYENILTGKDWAAWCKDLEAKGLEFFLPLEDMEFDECLLTLHIATEICYQSESALHQGDKENPLKRIASRVKSVFCSDKTKEKATNKVLHCEFSKVISDYMLYLLSKQPKMMSSTAGSSKVRFRDTCAHLREVLQRREFLDLRAETKRVVRHQKTCNHLLKCHDTIDRDGISESVLLKAVKVARQLRKRLKAEKEEIWLLTARLWVAVLFYAARHCKPSVHAAQLKGGGELLSLVWLLSVHFGLGQPFKIHNNSDHTV